MKLILFLVLVILFTVPVFSLQITEIMFNPNGSDSGREWIEIFNNGSMDVNISEFRFFESGTNHFIDGGILKSGEYGVIIDKNIDEVSNIAIFDSSFSLSNSGEYIALRLNNSEIDSVNYSNNIEEGFSLSLIGNWVQSIYFGGTPGRENIPYSDFCDIGLDIETDKTIFENKEKIKYKHRLINLYDDNKYNYTIEYWIEDLFNNSIRDKRNTTNVNKKSFTPNFEENISAILFKAIVYPGCNDSELSNNYVEHLVLIKGNLINQSACGFSIALDKSIVENKEQVKYKHLIGSKNVTIDYWIEDLFGNIVKQKRTTTNTNKKSFTPNIEEKEKVFVFKAFSGCLAETFLIVKNSDYEEKRCEKEPEKKGIEYFIYNVPLVAEQGINFNARVINNDDDEHSFRLSSYVFRGNKCFSDGGNRSFNTIEFELDPGESELVDLSNKINVDESGDYKLKFVLNQDNQKTDKSLVKNIEIKAIEEKVCVSSNESFEISNNPPISCINTNISAQKVMGVVYEADDMIIKKSISYFVIAFLSLIILFFGRNLRFF